MVLFTIFLFAIASLWHISVTSNMQIWNIPEVDGVLKISTKRANLISIYSLVISLMLYNIFGIYLILSKRCNFRHMGVDVIIEMDKKILLIRRKNRPFKNMLALPGGKIEPNETIEDAAIREAKEETNIDVRLKSVLGIYSNASRDPRKIITTVFIGEPKNKNFKAGSDALEIGWYNMNKKNLNLAFDHNKIISDYLIWKKNKKIFLSLSRSYATKNIQ